MRDNDQVLVVDDNRGICEFLVACPHANAAWRGDKK